MRVLVIGGYTGQHLRSMSRYGRHVSKLAKAQGIEVSEIVADAHPLVRQTKGALRKWLGYLDQYVLFPKKLKAAAAEADVCHLSDQGNAIYMKWLNPRRTVTTCHDLLAIRAMLGELEYWKVGPTGRVYQQLNLKWMRKCHWVGCVSPKTSEDAVRLLGITPDQAPVIPNSCFVHLPESRPADAQAVYHIGGNQPYKNRIGAVRIFQELRRLPSWSNATLTLVGAKPSVAIMDAVQTAPEGIKLAVSPNDEEAARLACASSLLLFPSHDEGFGLPILEAQSGGICVAASRKEPMRWVAGEGAILINPNDPREAAQSIHDGCARRGELITAGTANLSRFSEEQEAALLMNLYHKAAG